jgi:Na+/citrate or Na+/malate symporter
VTYVFGEDLITLFPWVLVSWSTLTNICCSYIITSRACCLYCCSSCCCLILAIVLINYDTLVPSTIERGYKDLKKITTKLIIVILLNWSFEKQER